MSSSKDDLGEGGSGSIKMDQVGSLPRPLGICTEDLSVCFLSHSIISGCVTLSILLNFSEPLVTQLSSEQKVETSNEAI